LKKNFLFKALMLFMFSGKIKYGTGKEEGEGGVEFLLTDK
jgi:hypothetical protein